MNVSSVNRAQTPNVKLNTDKIGVMVAQKSLEAARQNQESSGSGRTGNAQSFTHPFLGHNVDIYV